MPEHLAAAASRHPVLGEAVDEGAPVVLEQAEGAATLDHDGAIATARDLVLLTRRCDHARHLRARAS